MASNNYLDYGLLAEDTLTANNTNSTIFGDIGATTVVENISLLYSGSLNRGSSISGALTNAQTAYATFTGLTPTTTETSSNIGGLTFTPGVIELNNVGGVTIGGAIPNNKITLDGFGDYVFQVTNGDLITDSTLASVTINLINGALASSVYWVVSGSVDLQSLSGNTTQFYGTIIAQGNINIDADVINYGSLIASNTGGSITVNGNTIVSQVFQLFTDTATDYNIILSTNGYITLQSNLPDSQSIKIRASNTYGGINIQAGLGGIAVSTTNSINLSAQAASSFINTNGNLVFQARTGLTNIDAVSGINIGNDATYITPEINIGTQASTKRITVGNLTNGTFMNVNCGTGGFNVNTSNGAVSLNANGAASNFTVNANNNSQDLTLALLGNYNNRLIVNSQGTGPDAIFFLTDAGGVTYSIAGKINMVSTDSTATAIKLDTAFGGGGISLSSGDQGISLDAYNGGATNGSIFLIGGAAGIGINAYNGGVIGIGHFNGGDIYVGTAAVARIISMGNSTGTTSILQRTGASGTMIYSQYDEVDLGTGSVSITTANLLQKILTITPSSNSTITLPSAATVVSNLSFVGISVNDAFDFTVINLSSTNTATIAIGTGGTTVGNMVVATDTSATFKLRVTNTGSGTEQYKVYRIN